MTLTETKELFKRIKAHYPNFNDDDYVIKEWFRYVEPYEKEDVHKKFEQHLKGDYAQYEPKVTFLISYLKTKEEKLKSQEHYIGCGICGQAVNLNDFQKHHDRCLSVEYINKIRLKYFGKEVDKEKLRKMEEDKFIEIYEKMLDVVLQKTTDKIERKRIENYFFSKKGIVEFNPKLYLTNQKI